MLCLKTYRRHSSTYIKGEEYDVKKETVEADEKYMGEILWKKNGAEKDKTIEEKPKKTTRKKVAKKTK